MSTQSPPPRTFRCLQCDVTTETPLERNLFSCGRCGTPFGRQESADGVGIQCPDCRRYAKRLARICCPHCRGGELAPIQMRFCMVCGLNHDSARIPHECGGDGAERPAVTSMAGAPGGTAEDALILPASMRIKEVLDWAEQEDGAYHKTWRLDPRAPTLMSDCIVRLIRRAGCPEVAELTCRYCGVVQKGDLSRALTLLARGAHRHGATGLAIIGPDETIPGPPYSWAEPATEERTRQ